MVLFPVVVANIIHDYAGSFTHEAISDWFIENKMHVRYGKSKTKKILYCQYNTGFGSGQTLFVIIDADTFEVEFEPIAILPDGVIPFMKNVNDAYMAEMFTKSNIRTVHGSILVADTLIFKDPKFVHRVRISLNKLGNEMEKTLLPRCLHAEDQQKSTKS